MMCTLCGRGSEGVHETCIKALDARLQLVPKLYALLHTALEPGSANYTRVSGTPAAPLPVLLEPLSLLSRGGIVSILATWETDWRERRGLATIAARADREQLLDGRQVLTDVVAFLRAHLDWAARHHPAIDEFADEIRDIAGACRAVLGLTTDLKKIGRCPAQLGNRTCGRVLYADPYADEIRCDRCHAVWPRRHWILLGAAMAGEAA